MEKKIIREEILKKRSQLSKEEHKEKSRELIDKLTNSCYYNNAKTIMTFISFSDEVDTHEFIKQAIKDGKTVTVPVTFPKTKELKPSIVKDFNELEPGYYNILTPKKEYIRYIEPKEIDLVIVPSVAYDREGYRVGYGGGYYDRFLAPLEVNTIGISFDMQLIDRAPRDQYDIAVEYICTEKEFFKCK